MFSINKAALHCSVLLALTLSLPARPIDKCASRTVTVNVRDRQGNFITGLSPSSFLVTQNGTPITVSSADMEVGPRVVLLLDVTGSMTSQAAKWQTVKLVSEHMVLSSRNSFRVALVLFASDVVETLDFSHSGKEILERVRRLGDGQTVARKGKRQTALLDAALRASTLFGVPEAGDAIFVITDGGDNASQVRVSEVEQKLSAAGVRFFAFVLSDEYVAAVSELLEAREMLSDLARWTAGTVLEVDAPVSLGSRTETSLNKLYDQIARFYRLELGTVGTDKKSRWSFAVLGSPGKVRKDLTVTYPRQLPVCDVMNPVKESAGK
jgi:von Willebrand factor type A domain